MTDPSSGIYIHLKSFSAVFGIIRSIPKGLLLVDVARRTDGVAERDHVKTIPREPMQTDTFGLCLSEILVKYGLAVRLICV